jgi:hypothetical protein
MEEASQQEILPLHKARGSESSRDKLSQNAGTKKKTGRM